MLFKPHPYNTSMFNPLSPNINIQILLSDLNTFSYTLSWENLSKGQNNFPVVIILLILKHVAFSLKKVLIL